MARSVTVERTSLVGVENWPPLIALEPPMVAPVYTGTARPPSRPGLGADSHASVTSGVCDTTELKKLRMARSVDSCSPVRA